MCSSEFTAEEGYYFPKLESYEPKLEGNCYRISNPDFFLPLLSVQETFFFNHVSPLRLQNS